MAYKEVLRVEIQEVIRRWQAGGSQRQIAEGTGLSRATVRKYPCFRRGRLCRRRKGRGLPRMVRSPARSS